MYLTEHVYRGCRGLSRPGRYGETAKAAKTEETLRQKKTNSNQHTKNARRRSSLRETRIWTGPKREGTGVPPRKRVQTGPCPHSRTRSVSTQQNPLSVHTAEPAQHESRRLELRG